MLGNYSLCFLFFCYLSLIIRISFYGIRINDRPIVADSKVRANPHDADEAGAVDNRL